MTFLFKDNVILGWQEIYIYTYIYFGNWTVFARVLTKEE